MESRKSERVGWEEESWNGAREYRSVLAVSRSVDYTSALGTRKQSTHNGECAWSFTNKTDQRSMKPWPNPALALCSVFLSRRMLVLSVYAYPSLRESVAHPLQPLFCLPRLPVKWLQVHRANLELVRPKISRPFDIRTILVVCVCVCLCA